MLQWLIGDSIEPPLAIYTLYRNITNMINKQYLIFNTQQSFEEALAEERIPSTSIVFIKETGKIWTHGSMFGGETEVDLQLDNESYNPVANLVICRALADFYSKSEVNELLQTVPTMKILIVDLLPDSDINPRAIYIVKNQDDDNSFTEYIYAEELWVSLGTLSLNIDLSSYATSDELSDYVKKSSISDYLTDYVTTGNLASYATKEELESLATKTQLADYVKEENISDYLEGCVKEEDISDYLEGCVKEENLSSYATKEELRPLATKEELGLLATKEEVLSSYVTNTALNSSLSNFYSKPEVDQLLQVIPTMNMLVVDSLPTTDISSSTIYIVKSESDSDLFTEYIYQEDQWISLGTLSLNIDLSDYATLEELTSFVTKSEAQDTYATKTELTLLATKAELEPLAVKDEVAATYATKAELEDYVEKSSLYTNQGAQDAGSDAPGSDPYGAGGNGYGGIQHIILEKSAYDALTTYEDNAIYFVLEGSSSSTWKFGDTFPIHFGESLKFGDTLPITLI